MKLAPLDPDLFLVWIWQHGPRAKGTAPLALEDLLFEFQRRDPEYTRGELRRQYVRVASRVRRNQRLGLDPMEGLR